MGYIFENLEKMDIQEERRQRQQAQQELKEAKEKAQQKLKETQEKARVEIDQVHREADKAHKEAQRSLIETCQQLGATKDFTVQQLCTKLSLKEEIAKSLVEQYWQ